jgi:hypothetical protein
MSDVAVINKFEVATIDVSDLDGIQISIDKIKIPSGGGIMFEIPNGTDEPDVAKELVGVIVDHHPQNCYWEVKFDGSNQKPDCSSNDGKVGTSGMLCSVCPKNKFVDGKKECKNTHKIYLLQQDALLPIEISIPPASLTNMSNYIGKQVVFKGKKLSEVVTKMNLKKAVSGGGITYSQVQFAIARNLEEDEKASIKAMIPSLKTLTRKDEFAEEVEIITEE